MVMVETQNTKSIVEKLQWLKTYEEVIQHTLCITKSMSNPVRTQDKLVEAKILEHLCNQTGMFLQQLAGLTREMLAPMHHKA